MTFRDWLESVTGCPADEVLDIFDRLDKAAPRLDLHVQVRERWADLYAEEFESRQCIQEEYESSAREAAREAARKMNRIRETGL